MVIVDATDSYVELTMKTRGDIIGRYLFDLFPEQTDLEVSSAITEKVRDALNTGTTQILDAFRYAISLSETGFQRWWELRITPITPDEGACTAQYVLFCPHDVTNEVLQNRRPVE